MKAIRVFFCMVMLILTTNGGYIEEDLTKAKAKVKRLTRQLMMQRVIQEESVRFDGHSGIRLMRRKFHGLKSYHEDTFTHKNMLHNHDHANFRSTTGMGELVAVLNGVNFRTRHNDYNNLCRPSTKPNSKYHETEHFNYPDVPPEVTNKPNVSEQIAEMKEWFRAWRDNNHTVRDYRKYFKPVLCYLEGAWTLVNDTKMEEPFHSDRHVVDAIDWLELEREARNSAATGNKNKAENSAFLPSGIVDMVNDTEPIFAQWNYRILCHPLSKYLEKDRIRVIDNLSLRMAFNLTLDDYTTRRGARFQLNAIDSDIFKDGHYEWQLLDSLMGEIPGKNGYGAKLTDDSSGGKTTRSYFNVSEDLNVANYFRTYRQYSTSMKRDSLAVKGFADTTVFMAMTTHDKVAPTTLNQNCYIKESSKTKYCKKSYSRRWSAAIPLEIIYHTPLNRWNPYNLSYNATGKQCATCTGGHTKDTAYQFVTNRHYYMTPSEFFRGRLEKDVADTAGKTAGVLDQTGVVRSVKASGIFTILPDIQGVGRLRMRHFISPIYEEGNTIWKELEALKDLLYDPSFSHLRREMESKKTYP